MLYIVKRFLKTAKTKKQKTIVKSLNLCQALY